MKIYEIINEDAGAANRRKTVQQYSTAGNP